MENHDVISVNEANLSGCPDPVVLDYARQNNRILLTRNCDDFEELHQINPVHAGILAVYQNSELSKNMSYQMIGKAITNLEVSGYILEDQFVILNQWNY